MLRDGDKAAPAESDLLLFCHGFCTVLTRHHSSEDQTLFPAIATTRPELAETLRKLEQDHAMIAKLMVALRGVLDGAVPAAQIERHLDGIAAIMKSHFRYEERELLHVLDSLDLDARPSIALGGAPVSSEEE